MLVLARSADRCRRCGGDDVRPSRRTRGVVLRLLGLRRHRCMGCRAVILSPRRVGAAPRVPAGPTV